MRWIELAGIALLAATASGALAADSFSDVPRGHWAYKALRSLSSQNLVSGFKGRFQGDKPFTRYEMAVVLSRYVQELHRSRDKLRASVEKTYPLLERLSREFARELDMLGGRTKKLNNRVDRLEKGLTGLRGLVGQNQQMLRRIANRLEKVRFHPPPPRPLAKMPASMGGDPVHSEADVDRILAKTIFAVRQGQLSKTQAYSIGYLANILYRRIRDARKPGLARGMDRKLFKNKLAKLEQKLDVKRLVRRRRSGRRVAQRRRRRSRRRVALRRRRSSAYGQAE